jgi:hypothetical protein
MITFHTSTEIHADRRVVLTLPPETPVGEVELVVTIAPKADWVASGGVLRRHFGTARSGDVQSADNERIDADLARSYADSDD